MKHFWMIFPPGTRIELFIRTLYHKARATPVFTNRLIKKSHKSYITWLKAQNQWLRNQDIPKGEYPALTFLLVVSDVELANETIRSIQNQRSENWRMFLSIPNSIDHGETLQALLQDPKISTYENAGNSLTTWISESEMDYFVFCQQGDIISEFFVESFQRAYLKSNNFSVYHCDFETRLSESDIGLPLFKPPAYSPELYLSTNYLSRSVISAKQAKKHLQGMDSSMPSVMQEWELLLLLGSEPEKICHIPFVLLTLSNQISVDNQEYWKMIQRHLMRKHLQSDDVGNKDQSSPIRWKSAQPLVSIIIPTKNNFYKLQTLLETLFTQTDYPAYEIILVDTGSTDSRVLKYYQEIMQSKPVQLLRYEQPFNYSIVNNLGAKLAKGELLLFLNNDMQVLSKDWLSELSRWALIDEIGVVGTKLVRPNNTLQHIGIVVGLKNLVGHMYLNAPVNYYGLMGSANWYRNVTAVTGACQMMRRSLFEELGGYDENYELVFSDITLCLKAIKHGYRNLCTPHAALLHHEGASRGYKTPVEDILRGYEEMDEILRNGDPYFSPNLTLEPIPRCEMDSWIPGHRSHQYLERKNYYLAPHSKLDNGK